MAKHVHTPKTAGTVAIVGGESLLGKELREVIETQSIPARIKMLATLEDAKAISRVLTEQDGEPVVMEPVRVEDLTGSRIALLAGSAETSRRAYELVGNRPGGPVFIDLSGGLEDLPHARLRAPLAEPGERPAAKIHVIAHPAAVILALFLRALQAACPIGRCIVQIFEPASERGQSGLDELQQQTVGLLSFQKLKKEVYDAQVSFNLVPRFGEDAPRTLEDIEMTIDRHLASLLSKAGGIPMPSIRLVQAPVFHGYSFSLWVEFEKNPDASAMEKALAAADHIELRSNEHDAPTNAGVAGQSGVTVGAITVDRNDPRARWFWLVADNLRIAADNAVEVAREYLG